MKPTFGLFVLMAITLIGFGIQLQSQVNTAEYNQKVYEAEDFILSEDYCTAAELYNNLHTEYSLFNGDLHNALICALLCDNQELIEKFTLHILKRDASLQYFKTNFNEFDFFNSPSWDSLKSRKIEYTYQPEIRARVREMVKIDQADRIDPSVRQLNDFKNLITLGEIMEEFGFPTQKHLGLDYLGTTDRREYNRWFRLIMIHLTKLMPWDFGELLHQLYFDGIISRGQFVSLFPNIKFCDQSPITCIPHPATNFLMLDDILLSCNEELRKEVNDTRAYFYLDTVESQLEKSIFRRNSPYPWRIGQVFAVFHYNAETAGLEERVEGFKKDGLVPVEY